MVNSGADFFESHRIERNFVSCEEIDGKVVLAMNLYHKSANNMEAGMMLKRKLWLPLGLCSRRPDVIKFNEFPDPEILKNGKFSGPRTLEVQNHCKDLY